MQKLLHMVLMDKQHHNIQATVEDDLITTFIHQLKDGDVFIISNFKVTPNGGLVRVTRHRFRILFKCCTSIVAPASTTIPNSGLILTSIDQILQKRIDYEYLIDINSLKKYQRPLPIVILQSFKIKVNGDKGSLQNVINIYRVSINPDMQETVNFLNQYDIATHHFSRLCSNDIRDLVSLIDDEFFDWKLIRTIANLKGNNEDGQFFVVEKIKEIVKDQSGGSFLVFAVIQFREVQHFMITSYKIKILVENGISCEMFLLLDSAATKLLERTCSDVFLLKLSTTTVHSFFINSWGNKLFSKFKQRGLTFRVIVVPLKLSMSLVMHLFSTNLRLINASSEIIDVLKHQKWWYYCCLYNAPICHVENVFYWLSVLMPYEGIASKLLFSTQMVVFHSNGSNMFILEDDEVMQILKKICSEFLKDETNFSEVMILVLVSFICRSFLFIIYCLDLRPVGYELNTYLHIVHSICDDIDIVKFLEDSTHDNQQQTVNHNFYARISSSQGSNLFGNHQPLTIRKKFRNAFG
ncbi:hypothetical protein Ahy_A02g008431 [Arachis hypogaea]|uniref:Replication protein A 70 kDa DNA-binding subunit B/D first OB fold domain-containing protein n=1 Tax=Arachis hypogaea TaxID=3818 RepID=A0A445EEK7_ARAHY|nr:hypothetical protein Ahy_A02g008431 [Arachis hypogaea]